MAVYNMNRESLAEYLSDIGLFVDVKGATSNDGYRMHNGSEYNVRIRSIKLDRRIHPKVDVFVERDKLNVVACIPEIRFSLITLETSRYYRDGTELSFNFKCEPFVVQKEIRTIPSRYEDFYAGLNELLVEIADELENKMSSAILHNKSDTGWCFNTVADIDFDIAFNDF